MRNNGENLSVLQEREKQIDPERVFYHNGAHAEIREGEAIDFFAPKSENTLKINKFLGKSAEEILEAQKLINNDDFPKVKEILLADFKEFNGKREENVKKLNRLLKDKKLPEIKKLINTSGDIFKLRQLIENQVQTDKEKVVSSDQLEKIKEIRDTSYFLTKEKEYLVRGWSMASFDMKKILENKFSVFEANNETAHSIFGGYNDILRVRGYADSFKKIESLEECLKYKIEANSDYDSSSTRISYSPYCPEYMIQPPPKEILIELFEKEKDKLAALADKYWATLDYFESNTGPMLFTFEVEHGEKIDFLKLDPAKNDEDYRLIVNILFNEAIVDIKL